MTTIRPNRRLAERLAATADAEDSMRYSPDGFTPLLAAVLNYTVQGEIRRSGLPEPTSWMSMPDAERARIRPPRRRVGDSVLRLMQGDGIATPQTGNGEEVA